MSALHEIEKAQAAMVTAGYREHKWGVADVITHLAQRVEQAERERDAALKAQAEDEAALVRQYHKNQALKQQLDAALALFRRILDNNDTCPVCCEYHKSMWSDGHAKGCELDALLAANREETPR